MVHAFVLGLAFGLIIGALAVGLLAHRKPQWFAVAVAAVNKVDDAANALKK